MVLLWFPVKISQTWLMISLMWMTINTTYDLLNHMQVELKQDPMMTSSNGNIFRVTGPLCEEFTDPGEFPAQRPVTRSFDAFFDLRLNKRLSKQPWGWWFETSSWWLWLQCNALWPVHGSITVWLRITVSFMASHIWCLIIQLGLTRIQVRFTRTSDRLSFLNPLLNGTRLVHDIGRAWKRFPHHWPLLGHQWIPLSKGFLCC